MSDLDMSNLECIVLVKGRVAAVTQTNLLQKTRTIKDKHGTVSYPDVPIAYIEGIKLGSSEQLKEGEEIDCIYCERSLDHDGSSTGSGNNSGLGNDVTD
jgi:hypothetical protein